jgi:sporulation protein YlmC with PRC-barrel domain
MKKMVLSAVSVAALMMAGVAFAQDTSTTTNNADQGTTTTMPSTTDQNSAQTTTAPSTTDQNSAQTTTAPSTTDKNTAQTTTTQSGASGLTVSGIDPNNVMMASNMIGTTVYSANNENVGDINDIIIGKDGRVEGVVIGVGGFLGLGEKDVLIPLDRIQFSRDDNNNQRLVIASTKQDLENAPAFDRTRFMTGSSTTTTTTGTGTTTTTGTGTTTGQ